MSKLVPKAPGTIIAKSSHKNYFKAQVYTIQPHGPFVGTERVKVFHSHKEFGPKNQRSFRP